MGSIKTDMYICIITMFLVTSHDSFVLLSVIQAYTRMSVIKPKRKLHGSSSQQEDTRRRLLKTRFYVRTADEFSFVLRASCCRSSYSRLRLKCDGTRAETRFRLSAKRMSPFKWAGASVQSTTGSRGVHISGSNAGYTMFRDSVKGTG